MGQFVLNIFVVEFILTANCIIFMTTAIIAIFTAVLLRQAVWSAAFVLLEVAEDGAEIIKQPGMFAWQVFDAKVNHLLRGEYRIRRRIDRAKGDLAHRKQRRRRSLHDGHGDHARGIHAHAPPWNAVATSIADRLMALRPPRVSHYLQ